MELLIVDSSQSFIQALERRLGDVFTIRSCNDGDEALEELNKQKPDLLLIHLALPRRDGLTVLRQSIPLPEKLLVITHYLDTRVNTQLAELGVKQVLIQPTVDATAQWLMKLAEEAVTQPSRQQYVQKLRLLGFSEKSKGFEKILLALEMLEEDPNLRLNADIYPQVGVAAEKSIRDAIASAYRRGDRQTWRRMFPVGRPTNQMFLRRMLQTDGDELV